MFKFKNEYNSDVKYKTHCKKVGEIKKINEIMLLSLNMT